MTLPANFKANATGIQHLGLPTNDVSATKDFYHGLGFETIFENDKACFLQLGTLVVETYPAEGGAAMKNGAIDHVAINVNDIEAAWRDAKACGYETADEEINFLPFFENGVKFFTILGPNHEKVEFNQYL